MVLPSLANWAAMTAVHGLAPTACIAKKHTNDKHSNVLCLMSSSDEKAFLLEWSFPVWQIELLWQLLHGFAQTLYFAEKPVRDKHSKVIYMCCSDSEIKKTFQFSKLSYYDSCSWVYCQQYSRLQKPASDKFCNVLCLMSSSDEKRFY